MSPITTQRTSLLTNSSAKLVHAFNIYMDKVTCLDKCLQPRTLTTMCLVQNNNTKYKIIFYRLIIYRTYINNYLYDGAL